VDFPAKTDIVSTRYISIQRHILDFLMFFFLVNSSNTTNIVLNILHLKITDIILAP